MALRIPWDIYESVLLLDAYIQTQGRKELRPEIIKKLSFDLRKLAIGRGIEIDDIYRNINGITLQMQKIAYVFTKGEDGLDGASNIFVDACKLFYENPQMYRSTLQEANEMIGNAESFSQIKVFHANSRDDYQEWLMESGLTRVAARNYGNWLNKLNEYILEKSYSTKSVYEIEEVSEILTLYERLIQNEKLVAEHRDYFTSLRKYISYRTGEIVRLGKGSSRTVNSADQDGEKRAHYQEWLVSTGMAFTAARNYGNWLNKIDEYALVNNYSHCSIYDMENVDEIVDLHDELCKDANLIENHRDYFTSLRKYIAYRSDGAIVLGRSSVVTSISADASGEKRAAYQEWLVLNGLVSTAARNYGNWLNKIAQYAVDNNYSEKSVYEIETIEELFLLYERLAGDADLIQRHRDYLTSLKKYIAYRKDDSFVPSTSSSNDNTQSICRDDEGVSHDNPELYMRLKSMSKVYDDPSGFDIDWIETMIGIQISRDELISFLDKLSWVVEVGPNIYSFSKKAQKYEKIIDFDKEAYIQVLNSDFRNGMQFDSIDLENFRESYELYMDQSIDLSDADLEACLKKCGVLYQGRLFPAEGIINAAAREALLSYIHNNFENGKKALYYKAIYTDLQDTFVYCFNLTDYRMLKPYLEYVCADSGYFYEEEYISVENNISVNPSTEIEEYLLNEGRPLSYDELYAGLSHISQDVIKYEIRVNGNIILNEKEHYFHYRIFEFSSEDADRITEFISEEIEEEGYCIWSRVFNRIEKEMPLFIEHNSYLSSLGIRNAVSRKLAGRFNFDSEVISTRDKLLNMSSVYTLFGEHHAPFSDQDVYEFSKEVSGVTTPAYLDALAVSTVRVSKQLYVPKADVYFNVEEIDKALSTYLSTGYMLIKDVDSFLVFPNVGYEWNVFLLESFLMYYSKEYALINNGKSLNNVAGALVKTKSGYDDFEAVVTDVLANSYVELSKDKALDYLAEQNLLTRKSYAGIDSALAKARQIRNKKG